MAPSVDVLPFVLVHGPWIWKAALIAAVALVLLAIRFVRDTRARRRARDNARDLGGGPHVLRGKLGSRSCGSVVGTLRAASQGNQTVAVDWRADHVWIETDDGPVWLDGVVRVVAGHVARSARGVPRGTPDALADQAAEHYAWLRPARPWRLGARWAVLNALRPGLEVVAAGEITRRPASTETDYRSANVTRWLRGTQGLPVVIAATAPRAVARPLGRITAAVIVAAVAISSYAAMSMQGADWRARCAEIAGEHDAAPYRPFDLAGSACVKAAAMPGPRDPVWRDALRMIDAQSYRDEASVRQQLALAEAVEGCGGVVERLAAMERHAQTVVQARRCGDQTTLRRALIAQGKFAAAADVPTDGDDPRGPDEALVLIAAGRWLAAADAASARAAEYWKGTRSTREPRLPEYYDCLAELFRLRGGDPTAWYRLVAATDAPGGWICRPILAEATTGTARERLLAGHRADSATQQRITARLRFVHALDDVPAMTKSPDVFLAELDSMTSFRDADLPWLAHAIPWEYLPKADAWRTVGEIFDDNAYTRDADPDGVSRKYRTDYTAALGTARRGNGLPLAELLGDPFDNRWADSDVLAVLPYLATGRDDVGRVLAWSAPEDEGWLHGAFPFSQVLHVVARRSVLTAAHQPSAAAWGEIFDRYDALLADRDKLIAFVLWNR